MLLPRAKPIIKCGESKTQQHFLNECNINKIMEKVTRTGVLPMPLKMRQAQYGDFTGFEDYHTSRNKLLFAQANFERLPARIRDRFDNDPGELIEFLSDRSNLEEAQELGLVMTPDDGVKVGDPVPVPPAEEPKKAETKGTE